MTITTSLSFVPSDSMQSPIAVPCPPSPQGCLATAITLSQSPVAPDGTYVATVTMDAPTSQTVSIPFPTSTRLKVRNNALADLGTIYQPDDPRLFRPLTVYAPRLLQRMKDLVVAAIVNTAE